MRVKDRLAKLKSLRRDDGPCPPHDPVVLQFEEGSEDSYVAYCLKCGERGPERQDARQAINGFVETVGERIAEDVSMPEPEDESAQERTQESARD